MPTYRTSARNQFRTPLGAVGDPPDVPGYSATTADDIDNILGIGGAEYCATTAALAAIPTARRFVGKLAFCADTGITYRYVGAGGTALGSADSTHLWQGWHTRPGNYTPVFFSGVTLGTAATFGNWQISAGRLFVDVGIAAGSGFALTNAELDLTLPTQSPAIGGFGFGSGVYQPAGASGSGVPVPLQTFSAGAAFGASAPRARIRVPRVNSATSPQNPVLVTPFAAFGAGTTTDVFSFSFSSPSAAVA